MKENIKKVLQLMMMIAWITMLVVTPIASADDQQWRKTIHAEYAFTGTGACLFGFLGFNADFTPKGGAEASQGPGPNFWNGVITFNKDGMGTLKARQSY